jgi:hypothetical protein
MRPTPIPLRRLTAVALAAALLASLPVASWAGGSVKAAKATKAQPAAPAELKGEKMSEMKTDAAHDSAMAMMMKLAQPGPQHIALKALEGKWKAVVKSWNGPGEPTVSEGVADNQMILGGRYLEQKFTSTMMNMPFEGHGLTGYDNATQHYWFTWIDNMSTSVMNGTGSMDGKTLTVTANTMGPHGPMDVRMVTKVVDDNTHVFSMFGTMGGQEMLMMEITYTRM